MRRAVALYAFQSSEPGDLTFEGEEIIELTATVGDWWSGSIGNKTGIFPANYVSGERQFPSSLLRARA